MSFSHKIWCLIFMWDILFVSLTYFLLIFSEKSQKNNNVIFLQFVRRQFGKPLGSSLTESQTQKNTEPGSTPASMKTSAWTTWPRTSAALRSTWTWWPEWVQHQSAPYVQAAWLFSCRSSVLIGDSWYLVSYFQRVAEQGEIDGYVQTSFLSFVLNVVSCVSFLLQSTFKPKYITGKHFY